MKLDRRDVLFGTGALVALGGVPRLIAAATPAGTPPRGDAAAEALLAETAEELLREYPESASTLGLDKDGRAGLKSRLTDRSPEGVSHAAAVAGARRRKLAALPRTGLSAATRLDLAVADTAYQLAAEGYAFPFGDVAILDHEVSYRNGPYVVTQNMGAFVEVPEFLDSQHKVAAPAGCGVLPGPPAGLRACTGRGDRAAASRQRHRRRGTLLHPRQDDPAVRQRPGDPARRSGAIVTSLGDARRVFRRTPARWHWISRPGDRTCAGPADRGAAAPAAAGQHRCRCLALPQGDAYYAWALRAGTTRTSIRRRSIRWASSSWPHCRHAWSRCCARRA